MFWWVAAAGNNGCDCLHVPAALPAVLAVGAMDAHGHPLEFSNWGKAYQTQGILAPGKDITGAKSGGGTVQLSGTSFATPIVAGVAALLLSLQVQRGTILTLMGAGGHSIHSLAVHFGGHRERSQMSCRDAQYPWRN